MYMYMYMYIYIYQYNIQSVDIFYRCTLCIQNKNKKTTKNIYIYVYTCMYICIEIMSILQDIDAWRQLALDTGCWNHVTDSVAT